MIFFASLRSLAGQLSTRAIAFVTRAGFLDLGEGAFSFFFPSGEADFPFFWAQLGGLFGSAGFAGFFFAAGFFTAGFFTAGSSLHFFPAAGEPVFSFIAFVTAIVAVGG